MGLLTQVVTAVVNATGGQGSAASEWTEQQASNVDAAVDDATTAAKDGANDTAGFLRLVGDHTVSGVGEWIFGGPGNVADAIIRGGLPAMFDIAIEVGHITGGKLEDRAISMFGRGMVGEVEYWAGLAPQGLPAIWGGVLRAKESMVESARVRLLGGGGDNSQPPLAHPDRALLEAASRADDERLKMMIAFRHALQNLATTHPRGNGRIPHELHSVYSRSGHGIELARLSGELLGHARGGTAPPPNAEAARLLASVTHAAARGAVFHAEVLLWLAAIRGMTNQMRRKLRTGNIRTAPPRR